MRNGLFAAGIALAFVAGAAVPAAAMPAASRAEFGAPNAAALLQRTEWRCRYRCEFPPRLYWQWGWHHPPWQTPWKKPSYFWSLDPPRVPADVWARKWHPPGRGTHWLPRPHDEGWSGYR